MGLCEEVAEECIRREIERHLPLENFLQFKDTLCSSAREGRPAIWVYIGMPMYTDRAGDCVVKLKKGQLGVVLHWPDRSEYRVFNASKLWDDIVHPKPKQLPLWAEMDSTNDA